MGGYDPYTTNGGAGQNGSVTITWTAPPAPTCSITLSPSSYNAPGSATLSWSSANATTFYITSVGYVGASGSTAVSPSGSTSYAGSVTGPGGSASCTYTPSNSGGTLTVYPSCTFNGSTVKNGSSVTAYQAATVPYGSSCASQTRTCASGTLSGSYQYASCSVNPPASCTLNGTTVQSGSSATFYSTQSAPQGQLCQSYVQSRTCTNGTLSGSPSYQYASCSCAPSYSCSSNTIEYTNSQCQTAPYPPTAPACPSPSFCSAGSNSCLYPAPQFNETGGLTGQLQTAPQITPAGSTVQVTWNLSYVSSCTVRGSNGDGPWTTPSGSETSSPIQAQTTYTLACTGDDGSQVNETQVVNVVPVFEER